MKHTSIVICMVSCVLLASGVPIDSNSDSKAKPACDIFTMCQTNKDCKDTDCPYCVQGVCSFLACGLICENNNDCSTKGCSKCADGFCRDPEIKCEDKCDEDADCILADKCNNCVNGVCSSKGACGEPCSSVFECSTTCMYCEDKKCSSTPPPCTGQCSTTFDCAFEDRCVCAQAEHLCIPSSWKVIKNGICDKKQLPTN